MTRQVSDRIGKADLFFGALTISFILRTKNTGCLFLKKAEEYVMISFNLLY